MTDTSTLTTTDRIDRLAEQIAAARHIKTPEDQRFGLALLRLLAQGAPVDAQQLSEAVGRPSPGLEQRLADWPEAFLDPDGRVIAFMGLSLKEMGQHRLHLDGRTFSAWCAWDTLFLPGLLGQTARVTSRCPTTAQPIELTIGPAGPHEVAPPSTVVSFLEPTGKFDSNVIQSFCHYVHYFASPEAAEAWIGGHLGTFELSLSDAWQLAYRTNSSTFGSALAS
jgi:alkylmercury lyase